ncbi:MAG: hypothetical protein V4726_21980 [Verrucomicrobiota bacterium]
MAKVKLELQRKTDEELLGFATKHQTAMKGNENFPDPSPPPGIFDPALKAFEDKLSAITTAETALQTLRVERDDLRKELEIQLNLRGGHVETASKGDEAKILSSFLRVKSAATTISSLPAPEQVSATMGDSPGEIDLSCHTVARARAYVAEVREHSDVAAPGPWRPAKLSARSSMTIPGFTSGQRYAFRMRAIGPNELESPWSEEGGCMAP